MYKAYDYDKEEVREFETLADLLNFPKFIGYIGEGERFPVIGMYCMSEQFVQVYNGRAVITLKPSRKDGFVLFGKLREMYEWLSDEQ